MLWGARTPHKVCDTNISMTCFHKLTVNVIDCGNTSTRAMQDMIILRYFKTSFSCRVGGKSTPITS